MSQLLRFQLLLELLEALFQQLEVPAVLDLSTCQHPANHDLGSSLVRRGSCSVTKLGPLRPKWEWV